MNSPKIIISAVLALALPLLASAADRDFDEKILVTSQRNAADGIEKRVIYEGDVKIVQGSLRITADHMEIDTSNNERVFVAKGKPVRFQQKLNDGSWVKAQAREIRYLDNQRLVVMKGDAQIELQGSLAKGDTMQYDLQAQRLTAEAKDDQSRVVTIFEPSEFKEPEKKEEPQPETEQPETEQQGEEQQGQEQQSQEGNP
ncbi:lipopolysaccharide transport periplasmic protein LptA [Gallaecimonas xiamenensis]|uniref:Lipopolysaccharide transport periplasmic protein LptA n=1 Tax=Gallaecimonas xiamenensis 3-C-1 TaxID=745411 RepID=K2J9I0_9GAMM|nr:lipopolysaccharide transport periplasmic protein LptA [Gallaecimonas xiamenensis]EKE71487.1 lipopolysaccharide transport periplasmic protein LptA [Gallaecimonas xiamenensis 3-C-1]